MKILAVIVTHNRSALLSRCLDAIETQERPTDGVLVVDNGSTDGTGALLRARGVTCITQENLGSAGGWHRGIAHALEHGYDAVWLMDDDGWPEAGALRRLEPALRPGIACVTSVVLRESDPSRFVFPFPRLNRRGLPRLFGWNIRIGRIAELEEIAPDGTYPFVHFFNGALIPLEVVRRIGNIDREYYFFGEEVDYFFRLRAVGEVRSVLVAHHRHPDVTRRPYSPVKVYYYVKNTLILHRRYFDLVPLRNLLVPFVALARVASRNGPLAALSYLAGGNAPVLYRAIARGLHGRPERDFDV